MNWNALGAIAEIIGAVAVLATLAYLATQIRQNSRSIEQQNDVARAQTLQQRADSVAQLTSSIFSNEASLALMTKLMANKDLNPADLDPIERTRGALMLHGLRGNLENIFFQHQQGFLPDEFYYDVGVHLFVTYGPLFLAFNLPLTGSFRDELLRVIAEHEKSV